ncbi:MAG: hypothetical protein ACJAYY_002655 [Paraglaciecola sp.]|jgi:hypothetical protein|uniref:hypothetical protein n=1 Tax=Polaribacter sp. TaxID=1920175 RepID=UPI003AC45146|tara:strand:- start:2424 stop:2723 length:300 start_codon:yes stop_codon:yes gene_type:complete
MNDFKKITDLERVTKASLLDVLEQAKINFDNNTYYIKRHIDTTILIYNEKGEVLYDPVLPMLRKFNEANNLGVSLSHSSGHVKNTRVLGKDLINRVNEL